MSSLLSDPAERVPDLPRALPWITYGRRETFDELVSKWKLERSSSSFVPGQPKVSWILLPRTDVRVREWAKQSLATQSYLKTEILEPDFGPDFSESANEAVKQASGDWIGFVHGDTLPSPSATFQLLRTAAESSATKLVYANDVRVDPASLKLEGWLSKPQPSWLTLLHFNYIGWSWIARRDAFLELGGFKSLAPEEALHEFLLRFVEKESGAACSHSALYHRFGDVEEYRSPAFRKALAEHLEVQGLRAQAVWRREADRDVVNLTPIADEDPAVTVVTCFRDKSDWTLKCLDAVEKQEGVRLDVLLVDNQSTAEERARIEARIANFRHPARILTYDKPFHFARMNNEAIRDHAKHSLIFLLNNDVTLESPDAIRQAALWAMQPRVGTVGIRLRYPDGKVQHDGIRAKSGGPGRMARIGHFPGFDRFSRLTREVFASTFAACCFRRDLFEQVGGLCELNWVNGFGDVAFQLDCLERGYHHLYLGGVEGVHQESASRGPSYEYWEEITLEMRYSEFLKRMVREDLAWHPAEGLVLRAGRAGRRLVGAALRSVSPSLVTSLKSGLNALKGRVNMRAHGLD